MKTVKRKQYRYKITEVWGNVPEEISVGAVIRDRWYSKDHSWNFIDLITGQFIWGFNGELLGPAND